MIRYVLKRLGISAITLFGLLVVVFTITRVLPGDAAAARQYARTAAVEGYQSGHIVSAFAEAAAGFPAKM